MERHDDVGASDDLLSTTSWTRGSTAGRGGAVGAANSALMARVPAGVQPLADVAALLADGKDRPPPAERPRTAFEAAAAHAARQLQALGPLKSPATAGQGNSMANSSVGGSATAVPPLICIEPGTLQSAALSVPAHAVSSASSCGAAADAAGPFGVSMSALMGTAAAGSELQHLHLELPLPLLAQPGMERQRSVTDTMDLCLTPTQQHLYNPNAAVSSPTSTTAMWSKLSQLLAANRSLGCGNAQGSGPGICGADHGKINSNTHYSCVPITLHDLQAVSPGAAATELLPESQLLLACLSAARAQQRAPVPTHHKASGGQHVTGLSMMDAAAGGSSPEHTDTSTMLLRHHAQPYVPPTPLTPLTPATHVGEAAAHLHRASAGQLPSVGQLQLTDMLAEASELSLMLQPSLPMLMPRQTKGRTTAYVAPASMMTPNSYGSKQPSCSMSPSRPAGHCNSQLGMPGSGMNASAAPASRTPFSAAELFPALLEPHAPLHPQHMSLLLQALALDVIEANEGPGSSTQVLEVMGIHAAGLRPGAELCSEPLPCITIPDGVGAASPFAEPPPPPPPPAPHSSGLSSEAAAAVSQKLKSAKTVDSDHLPGMRSGLISTALPQQHTASTSVGRQQDPGAATGATSPTSPLASTPRIGLMRRASSMSDLLPLSLRRSGSLPPLPTAVQQAAGSLGMMLPQPSMVLRMLENAGSGVDPLDLPSLLPHHLLASYSLDLAGPGAAGQVAGGLDTTSLLAAIEQVVTGGYPGAAMSSAAAPAAVSPPPSSPAAQVCDDGASDSVKQLQGDRPPEQKAVAAVGEPHVAKAAASPAKASDAPVAPLAASSSESFVTAISLMGSVAAATAAAATHSGAQTAHTKQDGKAAPAAGETAPATCAAQQPTALAQPAAPVSCEAAPRLAAPAGPEDVEGLNVAAVAINAQAFSVGPPQEQDSASTVTVGSVSVGSGSVDPSSDASLGESLPSTTGKHEGQGHGVKRVTGKRGVTAPQASPFAALAAAPAMSPFAAAAKDSTHSIPLPHAASPFSQSAAGPATLNAGQVPADGSEGAEAPAAGADGAAPKHADAAYPLSHTPAHPASPTVSAKGGAAPHPAAAPPSRMPSLHLQRSKSLNTLPGPRAGGAWPMMPTAFPVALQHMPSFGWGAASAAGAGVDTALPSPAPQLSRGFSWDLALQAALGAMPSTYTPQEFMAMGGPAHYTHAMQQGGWAPHSPVNAPGYAPQQFASQLPSWQASGFGMMPAMAPMPAPFFSPTTSPGISHAGSIGWAMPWAGGGMMPLPPMYPLVPAAGAGLPNSPVTLGAPAPQTPAQMAAPGTASAAVQMDIHSLAADAGSLEASHAIPWLMAPASNVTDAQLSSWAAALGSNLSPSTAPASPAGGYQGAGCGNYDVHTMHAAAAAAHSSADYAQAGRGMHADVGSSTSGYYAALTANPTSNASASPPVSPGMPQTPGSADVSSAGCRLEAREGRRRARRAAAAGDAIAASSREGSPYRGKGRNLHGMRSPYRGNSPYRGGGAGAGSAPNEGADAPPAAKLSWCHVQHSKKQTPEMSAGEVKELVKLQLQTGKPLRAPWYRGAGLVDASLKPHGAVTDASCSPAPAQAQLPATPPKPKPDNHMKGTGTGFFCPALLDK